MSGRTEREAAENFVGFLQETISCVTRESFTVFPQSKKLYKIWTNPSFELPTRSGARLFLSVTQVFRVVPHPDEIGHFKVKTREYSYRLSQRVNVEAREILAYHWHPNDFAVRYPHLHVARVPRVHFPTSRVCLEDFILMVIKYYGAKPTMKHSEWTAILEKNKKAFDKFATWKIQHPA